MDDNTGYFVARFRQGFFFFFFFACGGGQTEPSRCLSSENSENHLSVVILIPSPSSSALMIFGSHNRMTLDIGLPNVDGYEPVRLFRLMPHASAATFIAVSGLEGDDKERSKAAGFHHHFVKPVNLARLAEVLCQTTLYASPLALSTKRLQPFDGGRILTAIGAAVPDIPGGVPLA